MRLLWTVALVLLTFAGSAFSADRPNVILILADDMGYSDPGCFGGEIDTPTLNRLADEGIRLTRFHNNGMCVVTRASLLTGQWWPHATREFSEIPLLSEKLKQVGYRTGLIGKWHLKGHPMDRGFDHFFGFLGGFSDHFAGGKGYELDREPFNEFGDDYYSSDAFTDRAIEFIQSGSASKEPFFLYLSFQAPHNPLQAPREDIWKYRGNYLDGWQAIRERRFERQKQLGIVSPDAALPAYPKNLPDWDSLTPEQRDLEDLRMAVFAAMIERMDHGIGRLVNGLREAGQADNTLIIFLSDNGTDSFSVVDRAMLKRGLLPGDRGSNWQPGTGWAYASVTPWRLYKISQHAGGITTGAVAWWPGVIRPGQIQSSPIHVVDLMPTLLSLAQVDAATDNSTSFVGESFAPALRGENWKRNGPLFFQYMDNRAIRSAPWTLTEVDGSGWELFHADLDPLETRNVADANPAITSQLSRRWLQWWLQESGEPSYKPQPTEGSPHYRPQGDKGSGARYVPSAMPVDLADRYPIP